MGTVYLGRILAIARAPGSMHVYLYNYYNLFSLIRLFNIHSVSDHSQQETWGQAKLGHPTSNFLLSFNIAIAISTS